MLLILGSLFLPFASRMASQAKEVEMLSTEELQRNQQLISQIYSESAWGAANLRSPTGGAAEGIPTKTRIPSRSSPRRVPLRFCTSIPSAPFSLLLFGKLITLPP